MAQTWKALKTRIGLGWMVAMIVRFSDTVGMIPSELLTAVILSCMLVMEITILTGKEVNIAAFLVEQATTR